MRGHDGVLRGFQSRQYGRLVGVDLATPDFAALARSVGMAGERVASVEEFRDAFDRAMAAEAPALIDIDMTDLVQIDGLGAPRGPYARPRVA